MQVVNDSFKADAGFIGSLDKACREIVNRNAVCKPSSKSPELIAKYADMLLKKSARTADDVDIELGLADIMTIFAYVEDKDVF